VTVFGFDPRSDTHRAVSSPIKLALDNLPDKVLAIVFPITAFVACGFEHSVANMYFLPMGYLLAVSSGQSFPLVPAVLNLLLVTIGNILGGTVLVALVYGFIYLRPERSALPTGGDGFEAR
jgi:formate/nitrite transporter FocA (FNT family)